MPSTRTRSEEHTSELQSQSHISYAVFCLNKKITQKGYAVKSPPAGFQVNAPWKCSRAFQTPVFFSKANGANLAFFFIVAPTTEIYTWDYTLSLHDALPIYRRAEPRGLAVIEVADDAPAFAFGVTPVDRSEEHTSELQSQSHSSYAVFCLKKKKKKTTKTLNAPMLLKKKKKNKK